MKYARWFGLPDKTEFKRLLMAINFAFFEKNSKNYLFSETVKIRKVFCFIQLDSSEGRVADCDPVLYLSGHNMMEGILNKEAKVPSKTKKPS